MLKLDWRECEESEGGGFRADTPIGDYVVYDAVGCYFAELQDGPEKQGVNLNAPIMGLTLDGAKRVCSEHFNRVYRDMSAMRKDRPNPGDGPMHPVRDNKYA